MTPSWTWRIPLGEGQKASCGAESFRVGRWCSGMGRASIRKLSLRQVLKDG